MSIYPQLDILTSRQQELSQAVARPARVRFHVDTSGIGESRTQIAFATTMLEEPTFNFGGVIRTPVQRGGMPLLSAAVLGYLQNDRGMYIGANMGLLVDGGTASMRVTFTLTFEGVALRAMNQAMR